MTGIGRSQASVLLITLAAIAQTPGERLTTAKAQTDGAEEEGAQVPLDDVKHTVGSRLVPPPGYERVPLAPDSFGAWLRALPVRPGRPPVHLYDGRLKLNQSAHCAVLDVDVGDKDLQQCADAVIRLRADYLFASPCREEIKFDFTSGDPAHWKDWRDGMRPTVSGNGVTWRRSAEFADGPMSFREYLETVFVYAGSASLECELETVENSASPRPGDVFVEGGFPGHAVLVLDVAENATGERVFLLVQSYMPAQDIHVLKSFEDISPWYRAKSEGPVHTPEWDFDCADLRRFPRTNCEDQ